VGPGITERQIRWCFEGVQVEVRRVRMHLGSGREGTALVEYWPLDVPPRRVKRTVLERLQRLQSTGAGAAGGAVSTAEKSKQSGSSGSPHFAGDAPRFFGLDSSSSVTDRRARMLAKIAVDFGVRGKFHTLMAATPQLNAVHHRVDRVALESTQHATLGADIKQLQGGHALPSSSALARGGVPGGNGRGGARGADGSANGPRADGDGDDEDDEESGMAISKELSALFRPEKPLPIQPSVLPKRASGQLSPTAGQSKRNTRGSLPSGGLAIMVDPSGTAPTQIGSARSSLTGTFNMPPGLHGTLSHSIPTVTSSGGGTGMPSPPSATHPGAAVLGHTLGRSGSEGANAFDVSPRRASLWNQNKKAAAAAEKALKLELQRQAQDERTAARQAEADAEAEVEHAYHYQEADSSIPPDSAVTGDEPFSAFDDEEADELAAAAAAELPLLNSEKGALEHDEEEQMLRSSEEGGMSASGSGFTSSALPSEPASARTDGADDGGSSADVPNAATAVSAGASHYPSFDPARLALVPNPPSSVLQQVSTQFPIARLRSPRSAASRFHVAQPTILLSPSASTSSLQQQHSDSPRSGRRGGVSPSAPTESPIAAAGLRIGAAFGRRKAAL